MQDSWEDPKSYPINGLLIKYFYLNTLKKTRVASLNANTLES